MTATVSHAGWDGVAVEGTLSLLRRIQPDAEMRAGEAMDAGETEFPFPADVAFLALKDHPTLKSAVSAPAQQLHSIRCHSLLKLQLRPLQTPQSSHATRPPAL